MPEPSMPEVLHVNRLHSLRPKTARGGRTGIDKRPVAGPVRVHELGLEGDRQVDQRHHGGVDKAVYAYAAEDYEVWSAELGRELPPGMFGENLSTAGLEVSRAMVGERWQVGPVDQGVLLEVTQPRVPCATFGHRMAEPRWVRRFTEQALTGAYLRVLREGSLRAGDTITVVERPAHGVTVQDVFTGGSAAGMRLLLELAGSGDLVLAAPARRRAEKVLGLRSGADIPG